VLVLVLVLVAVQYINTSSSPFVHYCYITPLSYDTSHEDKTAGLVHTLDKQKRLIADHILASHQDLLIIFAALSQSSFPKPHHASICSLLPHALAIA